MTIRYRQIRRRVYIDDEDVISSTGQREYRQLLNKDIVVPLKGASSIDDVSMGRRLKKKGEDVELTSIVNLYLSDNNDENTISI